MKLVMDLGSQDGIGFLLKMASVETEHDGTISDSELQRFRREGVDLVDVLAAGVLNYSVVLSLFLTIFTSLVVLHAGRGPYDLLAPGGDLPDEDVSQIFRLPSSGPSVSSPNINSSFPPDISQYQTFTWTPGGADWVMITVALNNGLTADGFEQVSCGVYDDGSFTLDGSQFTTWTRGAVALVSVGFVYDQSGATLPWNGASSAIAAIMTTKGGAYSY